MSVASIETGVSPSDSPESGPIGHLALVTEASVERQTLRKAPVGVLELINCQLTPEERIAVELIGGRLSDVDTVHHIADRLPLQ